MSNPIIENPLNILVNGDNVSTTISPKIKVSSDYLYQWSISSNEKNEVSPTKFETIPNATGTELVVSNTDSNHNNWYRLSAVDKLTNDQYFSSSFQFGVLPSVLNLNVTGVPLYIYANNETAQLEVLPSSDYTYIWKRKEITNDERLNLDKYVEVSSGSSNILSLTDLSIADTYSIYKVTVSGQSGEPWTSPPITLIYNQSINIIQENLKDFYLPSNGNCQLYAIARSANGTLLYKWQKSIKGGPYKDMVGQTKNVLNLSGLNTNDVGDKYRLAISSTESKNSFIYSSEARILSQETLNNIQTLNISPDAYITTNGVTLSCEFYDPEGRMIETKWLESTDKISWNVITGSVDDNGGDTNFETTHSVSFSSFQDKKEYYRCQLTDIVTGDQLLTNIITVNYNPTTYVLTQPTNLTTTNGSGNLTCQFFQNETGLYDYSWYRFPICGTDILEKSTAPTSITRNGALSPNYTSTLQLTNLNVSDNDKDRYVFIGKNKSTDNISLISKQAQISVPNTLTVVSGLPDYIRIPEGDSGSLFVSVSTTAPKTAPNDPITYQWSESVDNGQTFTDIVGAIETSLSLSNVSSLDNKKYYRVTVQDSINTLILK